jgi:hypothetical protein
VNGTHTSKNSQRSKTRQPLALTLIFALVLSLIDPLSDSCPTSAQLPTEDLQRTSRYVSLAPLAVMDFLQRLTPCYQFDPLKEQNCGPMNIETFLIFQYSNGVGHLNRCSTIAKAFSAISHVSMFSGGKPIEGYSAPPGINFVQLPAIRWDRTTESSPVPRVSIGSTSNCKTFWSTLVSGILA